MAVQMVLAYYRQYRAGFLPCAGGVADQPAFLMKAIEAADNARVDHEKLEAQQRDQEMRATSGSRKPAAPVVLGKLDPEDVGPGWRRKLKPL